MDQTEELARLYLISSGFGAPVYEPDGNIPPDFLLDGRIAVEVQRLTQRSRAEENPGSLEQLSIPLIERIQRLAAAFGPPQVEAWLLTIDFRRPLPSWSELRPALQAFLDRLSTLTSNENQHLQVHPNLRIEAIPRSPIRDEMFHLGVIHDEDSGGWMGSELQHSLLHAIEVKTAKIAPYQARYSEWWLLLVDHVTYARPLPELTFKAAGPWKRVLLVNPLAPTVARDLITSVA